jgi:DNA repair exonuclease SbcCD ATPase subunit
MTDENGLRAEPPTDLQRIAETPEKRIERLTKALTEAHAHSDNLAEALVKCEEELAEAEPPMDTISRAIDYLTSDHDLDTRQEVVGKTLDILRAEPATGNTAQCSECGQFPLEWHLDANYWLNQGEEFAWAEGTRDLHWMAKGDRLALYDNEYDRAVFISAKEGRTQDETKSLAQSLQNVLSARAAAPEPPTPESEK